MRFLGEAVVSWVENETREYNDQCQRYDVEYKGREEYFNFIQCLAGGNPGKKYWFKKRHFLQLECLGYPE